MAVKVFWEPDQPIIRVDIPKRPKKITATRFAKILDYDSWNSPFSAWCEITRTYEEPFVENKYTRAGKIIEPIIIGYLRDTLFGDAIIEPEQVYGPNPAKAARYDFFPDEPILGGMWDAYVARDSMIVEIKTSSRPQDWIDEPPTNYMMQAALYAYLRGYSHFMLVAAFLTEADYKNPEFFKPTADNVATFEYDLYEHYP